MTGRIGENKLLEVCDMMSQIRSAANYQDILTTIEKTRKALDEMLRPENDDFDHALLLQNSLLVFLKDKGWITADEYHSTWGNILKIASQRFPSDDLEEREEYVCFLKNTISQVSSGSIS